MSRSVAVRAPSAGSAPPQSGAASCSAATCCARDWPVCKTDRVAGRVQVVRGGRRLARLRHHLDDAGLAVGQWQDRWETARLFLTADGESDKRGG